jgi:hypothetical protein
MKHKRGVNKLYLGRFLLVLVLLLGLTFFASGIFYSHVFTSSSGGFYNGTEASNFGISLERNLIYNETGLVSYWKLDETIGTTIVDSYGSNNGSVITLNTGTGVLDSALSITADANVVRVSDSASLNFGTEMSAFIWVKSTSSSTSLFGIFGQYDTGLNQRAWYLGRFNEGYRVVISTDGTYNTAGGKVKEYNFGIRSAGWDLVGITWQNGILKTYVNGKEVEPTKNHDGSITSIYNSNANLVIGSFLNNNVITSRYNGLLDEAQVWNRALTDEEISTLYNDRKYVMEGKYSSFVFYNLFPVFWNTTLNIVDTYSNRTEQVVTKQGINVNHPNLISYWALDGDFIDSAGNNHGSCFGSSCPTNATGLSSGAMRFNGVSNVLTTQNNLSSSIYSLSFWFWSENGFIQENANNPIIFATPGSNQRVVRFGSGSIHATDETLLIVDSETALGMTYIRDTIPPGWNNLIFNWNGETYDIYLNNNKKITYAWAQSGGHAYLLNNDKLEIGARTNAPSFFDGLVVLVVEVLDFSCRNIFPWL